MIIFCMTASALQLCDYPHMFAQDDLFDPIYVIGDEASSTDVISATILSTGIGKYPELSVKIGTSRTDSEISDVTRYNAIIIGDPCINKAAADLEGNPSFCYEGLEGGKGYAKLFTNNGKIQLLITGLTAEDRKAMAEYLASSYLGNLKTKTISIKTNSGSQTPTRPVQLSVTTEESESEEIEEELVIITPEIEPKTEEKEEQKEIEKKKEEKVEEKKGFFGKIISAISNFFKNLFG